jgi:hypothetical protein
MFLFNALLHLLVSYRNHPISSNIPFHASHQDFLPVSHHSSTSEPKEFNHIDNHSSQAVLLKTYYHLPPNSTSEDSPPTFSSNQTEVELSTLQKYFRYYEILQVLQSPYVSQQEKIKTIQREKEILSTSSITPKIWNGLDW